MKRNFVKVAAVATLLVGALAFTACGGGAADDTTPDTPPPAVTGNETAAPTPDAGNDVEVVEADARDLGGQHFVIGNWWGYWHVDTFEPQTEEAEERLFDRIDIMERYNFTMEERRMGGWGEVRDMIPLQIMAGSRDVHIWHMEGAWFGTMQQQNLFAPLREEYFDPVTGINWHRGTIDASRRGGTPHAFATGVVPGGGVYFNMRLLEEAGLDPELPFDLQLAGDWTWDTFMDIARAATRDLDGDGVPDTWGIATFGQDFLQRALRSNDARYVDMDADGRFINSTNTPEFLEALTWANNLGDEGVTMPEPEGMGWDFFVAAFNNGMAAMRAAGDYVAGAHVNPNLADPWGFVAFPRGPRADTHLMDGNMNFQAVPANFSEEEVDDIFFVLHRWIRPLPGFDDPLGWQAGAFASHYHPRSVTETMTMFTRNPALMSPAFVHLVPGGMPHGPEFGWRIWHGNDPAVILEEAQPRWNEYLARANGDI
ncbi:MAG: extracellular solute-binding protein [Defluviitaleaceae bacterium]|nr:extracellular solute-binding protein [Defluviitaleaceae bacterium]